MSAVPTYADPLAFFPVRDIGAWFVYDAGNFVTWDSRVLQPRPISFFHHLIAVADAAGFDLDSHPVRLRFWNFSITPMPN